MAHHGNKHQLVHLLGVVLVGHVWFLAHRTVEVLYLLFLYDYREEALEALFAQGMGTARHHNHLEEKHTHTHTHTHMVRRIQVVLHTYTRKYIK